MTPEEHTEMDALRDLLRKKEAECRALAHLAEDLRGELRDHRVFVRLCGAVFPAMDGCRASHAALLDRAKSQSMATPAEPPCTH